MTGIERVVRYPSDLPRCLKHAGQSVVDRGACPGNLAHPGVKGYAVPSLRVSHVRQQGPTDHVGHGLATFGRPLLGSLPQLVVYADAADLGWHALIVSVLGCIRHGFLFLLTCMNSVHTVAAMSATSYTRCQSPAQVEAIATANHVPFTRTPYAASVDLGAVTYWWAAA